jgi:hypothetical protein
VADEHLEQVAALLAQAEDVRVPTYVHRDPPDEFERAATAARERRRNLLAEAQIHASLHVGEKLSDLLAAIVER